MQGNLSVFQSSNQHPPVFAGSEAVEYPGSLRQQDHQDPRGHIQTAGYRAGSQP